MNKQYMILMSIKDACPNKLWATSQRNKIFLSKKNKVGLYIITARKDVYERKASCRSVGVGWFHFNEYMHVYVSNYTGKKKKNYGQIFPKIVRERFSEKLDSKGLPFSMMHIL